MKGTSCLQTNLVSFYDKIHLADEVMAMDIFYLDFTKSFSSFQQNSPEEPGCTWIGHIYSSLSEEMTLCLGLKSHSE